MREVKDELSAADLVRLLAELGERAEKVHPYSFEQAAVEHNLKDALRNNLPLILDALAQAATETPTAAINLLRRWQEEYGGSTCTDREKQEEMDALDRETADYLAALNSPAREDCVRVPREPTEVMLIAARNWSFLKYGKPIGNEAAIGCYRAMLAAAEGSAND